MASVMSVFDINLQHVQCLTSYYRLTFYAQYGPFPKVVTIRRVDQAMLDRINGNATRRLLLKPADQSDLKRRF